MIQIIASGDCGNSPKNQFAERIAIGLERGDLALELLSADIVWDQASGDTIVGLEAMAAALKSVSTPVRIQIEHVVTHGRAGAVNGETSFANGSTRRFCHMFRFASAKVDKVSAISSYSR